MSMHNDCLEILEIILHQTELKPIVMNILLASAIQKQNF